MRNNWKRIELWLEANAPEIHKSLNDGIGLTELAKLERIAKKELPDDFVNFYSIHDGQEPDADWLLDGEEFLSANRIVEEYKIWKDLLDNGDFTENGKPVTSEPEAGIKNNWWNPLWIPFTYNGSGDHLCLDLDPAEGGTYGQIIRMWHDDPERTIEAKSISEWIERFATGLENGTYVYSDEYGGVINKDDID